MREAQDNDFDLSAVFKLPPQPEIWRRDRLCSGRGKIPS